MGNMIDFSVIIPHKNSLDTLNRLFDSIPTHKNIEIILVDNSEIPITKEQIGIDREYLLFWAAPERFAGGARNVGIENARGKWLVFSDSDDIFSEDAFNIFESKKDSCADVIYFGMEGLYIETGEKSDAGDLYSKLVKDYLANPSNDINIRISFHSPCAKMVNREYVVNNHFQFDEVMANNDDYFAMLIGYHAKYIEAVDKPVYVYIARKGSLMHRYTNDVIWARYTVILRKNKFLKEHGLSEMQGSVMFLMSKAINFGILEFFKYLKLLIKYRQNPFVGCRNWLFTLRYAYKKHKKNKRYITR